MSGYRIVSSDSHVFEPADLWTSRMSPRFKDRAPRIVRMDDGGDYWYCGHQMLVDAASTAGGEAGLRFTNPETMTTVGTVEEGRLGGWIPDEHVKDMDLDGIDVGIIYPTAGDNVYRIQDAELLDDVCRAYNDWIAEFCIGYPKRLKGIAMLNLDEVSVGVKELERCAKMGLAGALITVYPPENRGYDLPCYEPLWAAAQDLGMPLGMHLVTNRPDSHSYLMSTDPSWSTNADHWVRRSLGQMLFSGVFQRYPKLRVGAVEMEAAWSIHFLQAMDYTYTQRVRRPGWYQEYGGDAARRLLPPQRVRQLPGRPGGDP